MSPNVQTACAALVQTLDVFANDWPIPQFRVADEQGVLLMYAQRLGQTWWLQGSLVDDALDSLGVTGMNAFLVRRDKIQAFQSQAGKVGGKELSDQDQIDVALGTQELLYGARVAA